MYKNPMKRESDALHLLKHKKDLPDALLNALAHAWVEKLLSKMRGKVEIVNERLKINLTGSQRALLVCLLLKQMKQHLLAGNELTDDQRNDLAEVLVEMAVTKYGNQYPMHLLNHSVYKIVRSIHKPLLNNARDITAPGAIQSYLDTTVCRLSIDAHRKTETDSYTRLTVPQVSKEDPMPGDFQHRTGEKPILPLEEVPSPEPSLDTSHAAGETQQHGMTRSMGALGDCSVDSILCFLYRAIGYPPRALEQEFSRMTPAAALKNLDRPLRTRYAWLSPDWHADLARRAGDTWSIKLDALTISRNVNRIKTKLEKLHDLAPAAA